eukprot:CAMPEP_0185283508 /NCGR_PEP_ID=MMETSP1363-20130426/487_1 /TAXON_ID=38817 /ORGANISM="Gephyrocapsa oceanica, Strain RCC1303" /LENGTH=75 /DNA_ID=CAMNT_0027879163 /DNA_START=75 /DNA_END=302 /DNA_ORIENTATION=-
MQPPPFVAAFSSPNTIKEQQQAFQALKKISGNTHTAKGGPSNMAVLIVCGFLGPLVTAKGILNMWYGTNKYPAPE